MSMTVAAVGNTTGGFIIRQFQEQDAPEAINIFKNSFKKANTLGADVEKIQQVLSQFTAQSFSAFSQGTNRKTFVALSKSDIGEEKVVAWGSVVENPHNKDDVSRRANYLCMDADCKDETIGIALQKQLLGVAYANGLHDVMMLTNQSEDGVLRRTHYYTLGVFEHLTTHG